jgi:hypothetical protein
MVRLTIVVAALVAFASCGSKSPASCTSGTECPDGGIACTQSSDCTDPSFPACDTDTRTCAQCFGGTHDRCTGMTPRCEINTCVACVDDGDCGANGVCLASGACADASSVIHAAPTGSSMAGCGDVSNACTLEQALTSVSATKNVIKLDAGTYMPATSNFAVDANVTIDARGATLHTKADGTLLDIRAGRTVSLLGGTLEGATNGDGIVCNSGVTLTVSDTVIRMMDRSAINAATGCNLTVIHASISDTSRKANQFSPAILDNGDSIALARSSFVGNQGGGLAVNSGTFVIIGNVFLNNGTFNVADGSGSPTGGIAISTTVNAANRLAFNTVARNLIQTSSKSGGIHCDAGANIVGYYNIVWDNNPMAMGAQVSGLCKHTYSDVGPMPLASSNDAGHTLNLNPQLVNEQSDPHLKAQSPARGYASSDADLTGFAAKDIDGNARTAPADLGADQYHGL